MKTNSIFIFSAILLGACSQDDTSGTAAVTMNTAAAATGVEVKSTDPGNQLFMGTWKLFKKEDKDGNVLSTDNQFLEFKNDRQVEIKTTGTSSPGGWYLVVGTDTAKQVIRYLVLETDDRKFMNLKSIEEKNLILVDEKGRTMYFQKY